MASISRFAVRGLFLSPHWRRSAPLAYYSKDTEIDKNKPNTQSPDLPADQARHSRKGDRIATDLEQATGIEREEIEAFMAGEEDPFGLKIKKRPPGTKDHPCAVPSQYESRMVGCVCEENANYIKWMELKTGPPRRCECGHWFVLVPFKDQEMWFQNRKKWLDEVQQRWLDEQDKKWLELKERSKAEHAKGLLSK